MPQCGDFGGRTAAGDRCSREVLPGVRCWQHRKRGRDVLELVPKKNEPYPVDHLTEPARRAWDTYVAVVPESEHPELYAAILALNGSIVHGAKVADPKHDPDEGSPSLQKNRCSKEWNEWRKTLRLAERLDSSEKRSGLDKLRAM